MLVLNESPLIAAARGSFPAQVARLAGWRTVPGGDGPDYPRLSLEQLAATHPDLTLDLVMGEEHQPEAFKERMKIALGDLPVVHMNPDTLLRPGPQLIQGLKGLKKLRAELRP
jgi:ABC-type Fe3+-hydroxamate transport system substrate-binding protein